MASLDTPNVFSSVKTELRSICNYSVRVTLIMDEFFYSFTAKNNVFLIDKSISPMNNFPGRTNTLLFDVAKVKHPAFFPKLGKVNNREML